MPGHSKWSEIKRQKGALDRKELAARACRRMIARGERPLYRPRAEPDGEFVLIRIPELGLVTGGAQSCRGGAGGAGGDRQVARCAG